MYRSDEHAALVQTVDFFTPVVDDPYVYGQIAAANALSDVYAMGGRPLTALAIAALPIGALEFGEVRSIFRGGFDKLREAGVALLGGHTVQDREVKFGYSVTGVVDPRRVLTNAGGAPGRRVEDPDQANRHGRRRHRDQVRARDRRGDRRGHPQHDHAQP